MKTNSFDYAQYQKNSTLAFALYAMQFGRYEHIVVKAPGDSPGSPLSTLGGGDVPSVLSRFGTRLVLSSSITSEGVLQIVVE